MDPKDVEEVLPEIEALKAEGKLFSEDSFQEMADDFKNRTLRVEGHVSSRCPRLQYGLCILLCR